MSSTESLQTIDSVLDAARWAPSGDNTQPWRFEICGPRHAVVHGQDTRAHCVYDLDGWATRLSLGALVATARIAAAAHGWQLQSRPRAGLPADRPTLDLRFSDAPGGPVDHPLLPAIRRRSVQRRPYATRPLEPHQLQSLADAVGPDFELRWLATPAERWRAACLMFRSARLRLTTPEAYRVHRDVIEWDARFSLDRIPEHALGVPYALRATMRFALASWGRVQFMNRFLAGTWAPRLQMDLLPGWACGAHVALLARPGIGPGDTEKADYAGGEALQRLWLTATRLGLSMQPQQTPLIFARYALHRRTFSTVAGTDGAATRVGHDLAALFGTDMAERGIFLARLGQGPTVASRSLRQPLAQLVVRETEAVPEALCVPDTATSPPLTPSRLAEGTDR